MFFLNHYHEFSLQRILYYYWRLPCIPQVSHYSRRNRRNRRNGFTCLWFLCEALSTCLNRGRYVTIWFPAAWDQKSEGLKDHRRGCNPRSCSRQAKAPKGRQTVNGTHSVTPSGFCFISILCAGVAPLPVLCRPRRGLFALVVIGGLGQKVRRTERPQTLLGIYIVYYYPTMAALWHLIWRPTEP